MRGMSWLAEVLLASEEGLSCIELFGWLIGWLVGWSVGRLVGGSVGRLVSWSVGRLVGWLVGWSVSRSVRRSVGWLFFCWLVGCFFVGWLVGFLLMLNPRVLVSESVGCHKTSGHIPSINATCGSTSALFKLFPPVPLITVQNMHAYH